MWAVITPSGGSAIEIPVKTINGELSVDLIKRKIPQGDYIMQDRVVPGERDQAWIVGTDDFVANQRALAFGSTFTEGTCTLYAVDPADAAGDVKWKTNDFACSVLPETEMSLNQDSFAEYEFRIEANEIVTETFDGLA